MADLADRLTNLVNNAIRNELRDSSNINAPFLDIEDYTKKTGKRFRMTMEQKEAGMTREQAFQQFMEKMMEKE